MSEYFFVEKPFLDHLHALDWEVIDQGCGIISRRGCLDHKREAHEGLAPTCQPTRRVISCRGKPSSGTENGRHTK